ncbi:MAG: leucyl/phenylalanyl-tRNA--protein transferase [Deinococcales bacterium]
MSITLNPQILLDAYYQGIFPMTDPRDGYTYWYDPNPRTIIPLDTFHVPRRLERTIRQNKFEVRFNTAFSEVLHKCAEPRPKREETWLSPELIKIYEVFHEQGLAHSVETWQNDSLVGGVYGIALGGFFAGESMFSRVTDSSKVALVTLLRHVKSRGYQLFDVQFSTSHLKRFGAVEMPRFIYKKRLAEALKLSCQFI